jgi:hypothetical protein
MPSRITPALSASFYRSPRNPAKSLVNPSPLGRTNPCPLAVVPGPTFRIAGVVAFDWMQQFWHYKSEPTARACENAADYSSDLVGMMSALRLYSQHAKIHSPYRA